VRQLDQQGVAIENVLGTVFGCFRLIAGFSWRQEKIERSEDVQKRVIRGGLISGDAQSRSSAVMIKEEGDDWCRLGI
jgi:hypothetical protein